MDYMLLPANKSDHMCQRNLIKSLEHQDNPV